MKRGILTAAISLFTVIVATSTGTVIHKEIHRDGSKDFTIVKHIKKNQCTCSCKCIPDSLDTDKSPPPESVNASEKQINTSKSISQKAIPTSDAEQKEETRTQQVKASSKEDEVAAETSSEGESSETVNMSKSVHNDNGEKLDDARKSLEASKGNKPSKPSTLGQVISELNRKHLYGTEEESILNETEEGIQDKGLNNNQTYEEHISDTETANMSKSVHNDNGEKLDDASKSLEASKGNKSSKHPTLGQVISELKRMHLYGTEEESILNETEEGIRDKGLNTNQTYEEHVSDEMDAGDLVNLTAAAELAQQAKVKQLLDSASNNSAENKTLENVHSKVEGNDEEVEETTAVSEENASTTEANGFKSVIIISKDSTIEPSSGTEQTSAIISDENDVTTSSPAGVTFEGSFEVLDKASAVENDSALAYSTTQNNDVTTSSPPGVTFEGSFEVLDKASAVENDSVLAYNTPSTTQSSESDSEHQDTSTTSTSSDALDSTSTPFEPISSTRESEAVEMFKAEITYAPTTEDVTSSVPSDVDLLSTSESSINTEKSANDASETVGPIQEPMTSSEKSPLQYVTSTEASTGGHSTESEITETSTKEAHGEEVGQGGDASGESESESSPTTESSEDAAESVTTVNVDRNLSTETTEASDIEKSEQVAQSEKTETSVNRTESLDSGEKIEEKSAVQRNVTSAEHSEPEKELSKEVKKETSREENSKASKIEKIIEEPSNEYDGIVFRRRTTSTIANSTENLNVTSGEDDGEQKFGAEWKSEEISNDNVTVSMKTHRSDSAASDSNTLSNDTTTESSGSVASEANIIEEIDGFNGSGIAEIGGEEEEEEHSEASGESPVEPGISKALLESDLRRTTKSQGSSEESETTTTAASISHEKEATIGAEAIESEIRGDIERTRQESLAESDVEKEGSFIIERNPSDQDSASSNAKIENDGNEQIRQEWREALERLRRKLRAHREKTKEEKIIVDVEDSEKNKDGTKDKSAEQSERSNEENDDEEEGNKNAEDKEEKHLYLVQVVRDRHTGKNTHKSSEVAESSATKLSTNASSTETELADSNGIEGTKSSELEASDADKNTAVRRPALIPLTSAMAERLMAAANSSDLDESSNGTVYKSEGTASIYSLTIPLKKVSEEGDESIQDNLEAGDKSESIASIGNTSKVEHNNGNVKSKQSSTEITDAKSSTEKIEEASGDGSGEGAEENVEEGTQKAGDSKSSKLEHKTTPDFAFSIDSHAKEDVSKGKTTAASDQHSGHKAETNSKNQQKKMFNPWMTPTIQGGPVNTAMLRKKIEEERNIALLRQQEMSQFSVEEKQRMKELEERNRFLAKQERLLELELNASNEEEERQIREERKRLEKARELREEQMRIDRLQELNNGEARKSDLERREEITKELEQLAETERKQHEWIAQHEMEQRMKEKAVKMAILKAASGGSTNPFLSNAQSDLLKTITTKPDQPAVTAPVADQQDQSQPAESSDNGTVQRLSASQCNAIRKFGRVFKMKSPSEWVSENCSLAKQYFPKASCTQIQQLFQSCFTQS